jgi:serine/threonine-protein kinase
MRPPLNGSIDSQSLGWPTATIPSDRLAELLQHLADEFVAGRRRGQSPDMDEYLKRVPSQEEEFRSLVALMESLASSAVDTSGSECDDLLNLDPTEYFTCMRNRSELKAASSSEDQWNFQNGMVLHDRYLLERELGRGGMGRVFLATDNHLQRKVAIKVMLFQQPAGGKAQLDRQAESFVDEARLGAALNHPAIATVFDYGQFRGAPFAVFEFIEGQNLRSLLGTRKRLSLAEAQVLIGPVAEALDVAHRQRTVHRDLKPENLMVLKEGRVKILDLGLARQFDRQVEWTFAGTPAYAAPEQAAELPVDGRADQYALALIVYEMLTGQRPFKTRNPWQMLDMQRRAEPPDPRRWLPGLPDSIWVVLQRALSKDPNERFPTCTAFAAALGCRFLKSSAERPTSLVEAELRHEVNEFRIPVEPRLVALGSNGIWIKNETSIQVIPLLQLRRFHRSGRSLELVLQQQEDRIQESLVFRRRADCRRLHERLQELIARRIEQPSEHEEPEVEWLSGQIVPLVETKPNVACQVLGELDATARRPSISRGLLQLRAAMLSAGGLTDVRVVKKRSLLKTEFQATGTAIRVFDSDARRHLVAVWICEQALILGRLASRFGLLCLFLLLLQALLASAIYEVSFYLTTGLVAAASSWPMLLASFTARTGWPELLKPLRTTLLTWAAGPLFAGLIAAIHGTISSYGSVTAVAENRWSVVWAVAALLGPMSLATGIILLQISWRIDPVEDRFESVQRSVHEKPGPWRGRVVNAADTISMAYSLSYVAVTLLALVTHR